MHFMKTLQFKCFLVFGLVAVFVMIAAPSLGHANDPVNDDFLSVKCPEPKATKGKDRQICLNTKHCDPCGTGETVCKQGAESNWEDNCSAYCRTVPDCDRRNKAGKASSNCVTISDTSGIPTGDSQWVCQEDKRCFCKIIHP